MKITAGNGSNADIRIVSASQAYLLRQDEAFSWGTMIQTMVKTALSPNEGLIQTTMKHYESCSARVISVNAILLCSDIARQKSGDDGKCSAARLLSLIVVLDVDEYQLSMRIIVVRPQFSFHQCCRRPSINDSLYHKLFIDNYKLFRRALKKGIWN